MATDASKAEFLKKLAEPLPQASPESSVRPASPAPNQQRPPIEIGRTPQEEAARRSELRAQLSSLNPHMSDAELEELLRSDAARKVIEEAGKRTTPFADRRRLAKEPPEEILVKVLVKEIRSKTKPAK